MLSLLVIFFATDPGSDVPSRDAFARLVVNDGDVPLIRQRISDSDPHRLFVVTEGSPDSLEEALADIRSENAAHTRFLAAQEGVA